MPLRGKVIRLQHQRHKSGIRSGGVFFARFPQGGHTGGYRPRNPVTGLHPALTPHDQKKLPGGRWMPSDLPTGLDVDDGHLYRALQTVHQVDYDPPAAEAGDRPGGGRVNAQQLHP